jgi:hypothetical protein
MDSIQLSIFTVALPCNAVTDSFHFLAGVVAVKGDEGDDDDDMGAVGSHFVVRLAL